MEGSILEQLSSGPFYLICGGIIAFVAAACVVFWVRAWRAGLAIGMDKAKMKRAVTASASFSLLHTLSFFQFPELPCPPDSVQTCYGLFPQNLTPLPSSGENHHL